MRLNEVVYGTGTPVDGYGPGFFRVGGAVLQGAIIVGPGGAAAWQGFADLGPLLTLAGRVDVALLGLGADIAPLPDGVAGRLEAAGLAHEIMASPTACRSYNVLLGEGRRVALAALPVA